MLQAEDIIGPGVGQMGAKVVQGGLACGLCLYRHDESLGPEFLSAQWIALGCWHAVKMHQLKQCHWVECVTRRSTCTKKPAIPSMASLAFLISLSLSVCMIKSRSAA